MQLCHNIIYNSILIEVNKVLIIGNKTDSTREEQLTRQVIIATPSLSLVLQIRGRETEGGRRVRVKKMREQYTEEG